MTTDASTHRPHLPSELPCVDHIGGNYGWAAIWIDSRGRWRRRHFETEVAARQHLDNLA
jgi:hypothetical protein